MPSIFVEGLGRLRHDLVLVLEVLETILPPPHGINRVNMTDVEPICPDHRQKKGDPTAVRLNDREVF